jgi:predicted kinase
VKVECAEPVVRDRIEGREGDESDADVSVHEQFRGSFEPLSMDHETVDNSGDAARTRRRVAELL